MAPVVFVGPLKDHHNLYPKVEDFMKLLQDEGIVDADNSSRTLKYNGLNKYAIELYKKLKLIKVPGLDKNITRGKKSIVSTIVSLRKHTDKASVFESLRNYGKRDSTKVFIIKNDVEHAGFDILLSTLETVFLHSVTSSEQSRDNNDALRVAGILLLPKYRGTVDGIMNKKRDRAKSDQAMDPEAAFYEEAALDFNDPKVIISHPKLAEYLSEYHSYDPNDISRIELTRDGNWFAATWREYIRRKYRVYLRKWNKDTGGGDGRSECFENFCENSKWCAWIFLLDEENGFLLACTTSGATPRHLNNEAGFSTDSNNLTNGDDIAVLKSSHSKLLRKADDTNTKINSICDDASTLLNGLNDIAEKLSGNKNVHTPRTKAYMEYEKLSKQQKVVANDDFCSPVRKQLIIEKLNKEKNKCLQLWQAPSPTKFNNTQDYETPDRTEDKLSDDDEDL